MYERRLRSPIRSSERSEIAYSKVWISAVRPFWSVVWCVGCLLTPWACGFGKNRYRCLCGVSFQTLQGQRKHISSFAANDGSALTSSSSAAKRKADVTHGVCQSDNDTAISPNAVVKRHCPVPISDVNAVSLAGNITESKDLTFGNTDGRPTRVSSH